MPRGFQRLATEGFLLFLFVFVVFEISINTVWATDHPTSFIQLDSALLSSHSVALGHASSVPPGTVDDFRYGGQNYSALAPGTAFLALPFMAVGFALAGGYTAYGPALVWSETFVSLAGALAALLVYKTAGLYFRRSTSLFLGLAFAFSTISWPFATYFFQSDVSAMLVLAAAYFALKAVRAGGAGAVPSFLCGLVAGLAFTSDYVDAVVLPVFLAFLVVRKRGSARSAGSAVAALLLGALPGFAAMGAYDYAIFGNLFMTTEAAYHLGTPLFSEFSYPILSGLALNLVTPSRGLLLFAPITLLGILGYADALRVKGDRSEMFMMLAIFLGILLPYSAWSDPTGGLSFGPRFIVAAIPFLLLPAGFVVEQARGVKTLAVYALYAAGAVINGMAAFVTVVPPYKGPYVSPFTTYIVPRFAAGGFDSMWAAFLGSWWLWGGLLVVGLGVAVPLLWVEEARRGVGATGGAKTQLSREG